VSDTSLIFNLLAIDKASEKILGVKGAFGLLAVGVAAGAAAVATKSIQMAADYESATTRLITSAGETHQNIDLVRKGMLTMAGQVGDSAQSLATAMYTVESGGRHGAEGLLVLRAAAEGAKAEGADLTTVADALTSVLQDYHLKGSDAANVTSKLVAAVGAGKTTFEQFAGSLHSVLPIASSANISLEDITAALASMTVHGVSAEQASQNLADVIKHMVAPTQVQTKELGQLGVSSSNLANMLGKRGLTGTLQYLSELIISHMGPSGRVLMNSFNQSKDAARDVQVMVSKLPPNLQDLAKAFMANSISLKDWRTDLKKLPPEQANLLQQFAALQNRASGFNDLLKSGSPAAQTYQDALRRVTGDATGLNVALQLTGENTDYVRGAVKTISGATAEAGNHVKGWSDVQTTFNQRMSEFKAYVGAAAIQLGNYLLPAAKDVLGVVMDSVSWLAKHKTVSEGLGIALGTLTGAFVLYKTYLFLALLVTKAHTIAVTLHTLAVNASKIAIGTWAIVQGLATTTLWTWIGVQAIDFAAWVRKAAATVVSTAAIVAHGIAMVAVGIATKAWTAAQWLLNIAMDANPIGLIILAVAALAIGIWYLWNHSEGFRKFFISMWNAIWGFLKGVGAWFAGPFAGAFVTAYHWITNAAGTAADWIHNKWSAIINFFTSMPGKIRSLASGMWNGIVDAFRWAINSVIDLWNGLSFPGISIPGFGSIGSIGVPQIPHLATGGQITRGGLAAINEHGAAEVVSLPTGSTVYPHGSGPGGRPVVNVYVTPNFGGGSPFDEALKKAIRYTVRVEGGGSVQTAYGTT
jgi:TP901 family phage tail tape measure protein